MGEEGARLIVLITTGIEEYQVSLLRGIHPVLDAHHLARVIYMDWGDKTVLPTDLVQYLRLADPVGVLTTQLWRPGHLEHLVAVTQELSLPAVIIGADIPGLACVKGDNRTGMRALMSHLLDECGVRRPVLVRGLLHQEDSAQREAIFREELALRDLPFDEELVLDGEFVSDIAHRRLRALLKRRRDFDAVVAVNDRSARGCIGALTDAGIRVPEDVLVAGFDNDQDTLQWPGLTSVDQDLPGQGRTAAELLVERVKGDPVRPVLTVPSSLVIRDSTSVTPRSDREQLAAALRMVETAQAHLTHQDALASLVRMAQGGRTVDEVVGAFTSCLSWLKIRRCFLALRADMCGDLQDMPTELFGPTAEAGGDDSGESTPRAATSSPLRLVLDYRDGTVHPVPPGTFPVHHLLPDELSGELTKGLLVVTALVAGDREYGHLLLERGRSEIAFEETVHADLTRALDSLFSRRALEAHAANLEIAVARRTEELGRRTEELARRTEELQSEVATRQRAEGQLHLANAELTQMAMRDGLTGIANRSAFERHLSHH